MMVRLFKARRVRIAAIIAFTALCIAVWFWLNAQRWAGIDQLVDLEVAHETEVLQRDITASVHAVQNIAQRMAAQSDQGYGPFAADADFFMEIFPGANAVSFLDADNRVAEIRPASLRGAIGFNVAEASEDRRRALARSRDRNLVTLSDPLESSGSKGKAFAVFFPIRQDGVFRGTISLFFAADIWLNHLRFRETPNRFRSDFASLITLNGEMLLESGDFKVIAAEHASSAEATILDGAFRITLAPRPQFIDRHWNWTAEMVTGMLLAGLAAFLTCLTYMQRAQNAERSMARANLLLLEGNELLRTEISVRQEAEIEARQARASSEKFLATMSHEIRTPLNAIMGMFQLIEGADIPERQRRQARTGLSASERLFRELTHVIDSSRLDAGAVEIIRNHVPTEALLQEWAGLLNGLVQRSGKDLAVDLRFATTLPDTLWIDRTRVGQIVTNLMDNAVKFSPQGKVMLTVRPDDADPDILEICVSDSGPGVPDDLRESVFDRFYQINDGEARPYQGSGLGLAISRELAGLMGGDLKAIDPLRVPNVSGAVFSLTLPGALQENAEHLTETNRINA